MNLEPYINASPDIIIIKDKEGRWMEANRKTLKLFNIEEYLGKTNEELGELYPHFAEYVPAIVKSDLQAWKTGKQIEVKESIFFYNQERIYEVIKVPIFDSAGNRQNLIVFGRDITKLEKSEQTYKSLFLHDPDGVYTLDKKGNFLDVNKVAVEISGYTKEELTRLNFRDLIVPEQLPKVLLRFDKVCCGTTQGIETQIIRKDGEIRDIKLTTIPLKLNDQVIGIHGIAQDITDKKNIEELQKKQKTILSRIAVGEPLEQIIENITESVEDLTKGICSIMYYEKEHNWLRFGYSSKLDSTFIEKIDKFPVGENFASCGHSAYTKELKIVADIETDSSWSNWKEIALAEGLRSCWSLPIISSKDSLLGTFAIYYKEPVEPKDSDIEMLKDFSHLTGIALERHFHEEKIKYLANYDSLTNLPNLRYLKEIFSQRLQETNHLAVMFLDLDNLKPHNDTFGHSSGDRLIQEVGKRIQDTIGENNVVARMGGDEFVILISKYTSKSSLCALAAEILQAIEEPIIIDGQEFSTHGSIGISLSGEHGQTFEELMKNADIAMYSMKKVGGNAFNLYDPKMNENAVRAFQLKSNLKKALKENEFVLYYQPKVNIETGNFIGVEALIRWISPEKGVISPAAFISLAEESDFILLLGEWILNKACAQIKEWEKLNIKIPIAINVSIKQLLKQDFAALVSKKLREYKISSEYLEIEITESVLSNHESLVRDTVSILRSMGIKVSIDDFGTGYASFMYLKQFQADTIKIDKSFISHLPASQEDAAIVSAIIILASELGMNVIAEGVETQEQSDFLKSKGCTNLQGYLYSKPLPPSEILSFLTEAEGRFL
ncbi:bifunctional diguanylate cyclase/phosphodiesterase [Niallia circulans]|uniref:bifunctional diguanylate cyclase/phosphodiesterase n=1 Tax=Niallia circulans TaxID=1397 RepID=UPI0013DE402F|nr:GGDEF and EAL domain-containing protein [Niallia circulans]